MLNFYVDFVFLSRNFFRKYYDDVDDDDDDEEDVTFKVIIIITHWRALLVVTQCDEAEEVAVH